jgi:hypothetical protein
VIEQVIEQVIKQINLYIPPEIAARIDTGELLRNGSVVRDAVTKQFVKHLDEAARPAESPATVERPVASLRSGLRNPWVAVGVTVAGVAVVAGAALIAARKRKRAESADPECLRNFNASLRTYLEAAREGRLDVGVISQLISDLDAVQTYSVDGVITVDLSVEQWKTLVDRIGDYTTQLAEANAVEPDEVLGDAPGSENAAVVDLRRYLKAQRRIFTRRPA